MGFRPHIHTTPAKERPVGGYPKGGLIAQLEAELAAAEAAAAPPQAELRKLSDDRNALRERILALKDVETVEAYEQTRLLQVELEIVQGSVERVNAALLPGGSAYRLLQARNRASAQLNTARARLSENATKRERLLAELARLAASDYYLTGDKDALTVHLEVKP
jgi:prefoldin subunit 5